MEIARRIFHFLCKGLTRSTPGKLEIKKTKARKKPTKPKTPNKKIKRQNKKPTKKPPKPNKIKNNSKNELCVPAWDCWEISVLSTKLRIATCSSSYLCFDTIAYRRSSCVHTCASTDSILKLVSPNLRDYTRKTWDTGLPRFVCQQSALFSTVSSGRGFHMAWFQWIARPRLRETRSSCELWSFLFMRCSASLSSEIWGENIRETI